MKRHKICDVFMIVKIYVKFFWVWTPVSGVWQCYVWNGRLHLRSTKEFHWYVRHYLQDWTVLLSKRPQSKYVHIGINTECSPNLSVALCQLFSTFIHIRGVYDRPVSVTTTKGLRFNPHQELKQGRPIFLFIDPPLLLLRFDVRLVCQAYLHAVMEKD